MTHENEATWKNKYFANFIQRPNYALESLTRISHGDSKQDLDAILHRPMPNALF